METQLTNDKYLLSRQVAQAERVFVRPLLLGESLRSVDFIKCELNGGHSLNAVYDRCRWMETNWVDGEFANAVFDDNYFRQTKFANCTFRKTLFRRCTFDLCSFQWLASMAQDCELVFQDCLFVNMAIPNEKAQGCLVLAEQLAVRVPEAVAAVTSKTPPAADERPQEIGSRFGQLEY